MLKHLTNLDGVSGNENAVREFVLEQIAPYADEVKVDTMGNVIALKKGTRGGKNKTVVCAHMDEVGLIISEITESGFLKFKPVGGLDDRILLTQRVRIGENKVPGIIGVKAVHLQEPDERKRVIRQKNLYIDIGASNKGEAAALVKLGDYAAFDSDYREIGDCIKAKALDDRIGCMILLECIRHTYAQDIYFCFTVQEETGLRGARILAHRLEADVALVLEATTAADIPFVAEHEQCTRQGNGAAVSVMDRGSASDRALVEFITTLADRQGIRYQYKQTGFGGNDAGAFAATGGACRTAAISAPCRYIHSPVSTVRKSDISDMRRLVRCTLEHLHELEG
ncbi:MAG: M42 family metallopeptidase [Ruminococcaceae bacterium]|nr:M42 family metallopeptidase [Oscillospiraceae bacterium]